MMRVASLKNSPIDAIPFCARAGLPLLMHNFQQNFAGYVGEVMLGDLARSGFDVVDDHDEADAIVVNTCAFVEEAKAESLEVNFPCTRFLTSGLPYALLFVLLMLVPT